MSNQASEVRKALKTAILSLRYAEIATRPSSIEDADKSFESAVQYISDVIRTEKLKLLAEVRANIGTHLSVDKSHICRFNDGEQNCDCFINGRNDLRDEQRDLLTKLEAEL